MQSDAKTERKQKNSGDIRAVGHNAEGNDLRTTTGQARLNSLMKPFGIQAFFGYAPEKIVNGAIILRNILHSRADSFSDDTDTEFGLSTAPRAFVS